MDRVNIKQRAKAAFLGNYWKLVGTVLLAIILIGGIYVFTADKESLYGLKDGFSFSVNITSRPINYVAILYSIFVGNVVAVGLAKVGLAAFRNREFELADLFYFFTGGRYVRTMGTMALVTVFTTLGFICLVIPGIIVSLGLSQVVYLLVEDENIAYMDAIKKSWEMTRGYKGDLFVMILSFIGWFLLALVTFGIAGVLFVNPYLTLTFAGYHNDLAGLRGMTTEVEVI
ncbi:MAG: DUF975 family protein [Clostridiales bacterium]|nr:DUF975 family protein [Clostridiales bacterium]